MTDSDSKRREMLEEDDLPQKQRRRAASAQEVYVYIQNSFSLRKKGTMKGGCAANRVRVLTRHVAACLFTTTLGLHIEYVLWRWCVLAFMVIN